MNLTATSLAQGELFGETTSTASNLATNCVGLTPNANVTYTFPNSITGGSFPISGGGSITTGTVTTPYIGPTTTIAPNTLPNTYVWPTPVPTPPNSSFNIQTDTDDNGKDILIMTLGDKKNCNYKLQLLPGIFLYSNHRRPGFIQRMIFRFLFGFKWESTLAERFINAL